MLYNGDHRLFTRAREGKTSYESGWKVKLMITLKIKMKKKTCSPNGHAGTPTSSSMKQSGMNETSSHTSQSSTDTADRLYCSPRPPSTTTITTGRCGKTRRNRFRFKGTVGKVCPVQSSPVQSGPVRSSPVQSGPVRSSPVQSSPVQSSPVQSSRPGKLTFEQNTIFSLHFIFVVFEQFAQSTQSSIYVHRVVQVKKVTWKSSEVKNKSFVIFSPDVRDKKKYENGEVHKRQK